ncbi:MAG: DoxX family membrane protein [Cyclobacteriaceae bacterium]|tara:strand:- start:5799 stop:6296 length:498 start_codon:yes stop_codon:yes gene_type:complete
MSFDKNEQTIGSGGIIALTLLRILIGWHFLYEGFYKLAQESWTAKPVLNGSKWIMNGVYSWIADSPSMLSFVDSLNMYGMVILGFGLILGLFTRWLALGGAVLLLLFYLINPPLPGLYYTTPTEGHYLIVNKNLIEMMALVALVFIPTGKFFGLDRFLYAFLKKS